MNLKELAKEIIHSEEGHEWFEYGQPDYELSKFKGNWTELVESCLKKAYDLGRASASPKYSLSAHNLKSKFNLQGFK